MVLYREMIKLLSRGQMREHTLKQCRALAAEYARAELRNAETEFYIWGRASRSRTIVLTDPI